MKRLLVFVVLLLSSCANLPTITSISENGNKVDGYRFYDADSKIRYQVSHSDKALHIRLNTTDRVSITKILDFGLHFYFDPVAKKSKKTYIHYPIGKVNNEFAKGMGLDRNGTFDLKSKVLKVSQEYLFKQEGKDEQLLQAMLNTGIQVAMKANSADELTYDLTIPFDKISNTTLSNLSIGIVSGSVERSEDDSRPPQQQNNNMRPGNQMGGNVGKMRTRIAPMEQPIEIWFQLEM